MADQEERLARLKADLAKLQDKWNKEDEASGASARRSARRLPRSQGKVQTRLIFGMQGPQSSPEEPPR